MRVYGKNAYTVGVTQDPTRCVMGVWSDGRGRIESQCSRKKGHGYKGNYCKQHAWKRDFYEPKSEAKP